MKASLSAGLLLLLQGAPPLDVAVDKTLQPAHHSPRADDAEFLTLH